MTLRSIRNLDCVVLLCKDLASMRRFYETTSAYGHRTLFFRDPERNVLEIYAEV